MTGYIIRVQPDGSEDAIRTRDTTISVAVGPNGLIYTTSANERAVHVDQPDGEFVETIPHGIADSPADLIVDSTGTIYLPFFSSGKLLRIFSGQPSQVIFVAEELGTPGGIAMDSRGANLYVGFLG
jgi:sugar lactone lactonase YvrE